MLFAKLSSPFCSAGIVGEVMMLFRVLLYVIRKLATDFLQLLVLHEMSKKLYHWKA